ncbi:hypothetical protein BN2475_380056 [Paraburkholderia ribeironis]|uniref:Uncharacterized protein n=1 Tax=Paraburkholderia ribeironis TaxID=1247936 RepID=A0A1N7S5W1_9BURK|nr:hypothetical protein BN2475_380056 [Paraburkholderia ribeironis]
MVQGELHKHIALPLAASELILANHCNTDRLIKDGQIVIVHEVNIYDVPHGLPKKFCSV